MLSDTINAMIYLGLVTAISYWSSNAPSYWTFIPQSLIGLPCRLRIDSSCSIKKHYPVYHCTTMKLYEM
ncbi:hypothetical protein T06_9989 [Trichinella sp. T6]|nr:hypothetical protein T06_9989 [Trichinella sp. T6]